MAHLRDDQALRDALERHSVKGYPVHVPIFGPGHIVLQTPTVGAFTYYLVEPVNPMPFDKFAEAKGLEAQAWDLAKWKETYEYGTHKMPRLQPELQDILESGGKVSEKDMQFADSIARGCMNEEQMITCEPFDTRSAYIPADALMAGMLVEAIEGKEGKESWPGRVVSAEQGVLLLDLLIPVTYLRAPDAILSNKIQPGFHSKSIVAFGQGLAQAWEDQGKDLPEGQWSKDDREYELRKPIRSSVVKNFCKEHYPSEPHCYWHGLLMYVLPLGIDTRAEYHAKIRPLPEKAIPPEWVVPAIEER